MLEPTFISLVSSWMGLWRNGRRSHWLSCAACRPMCQVSCSCPWAVIPILANIMHSSQVHTRGAEEGMAESVVGKWRLGTMKDRRKHQALGTVASQESRLKVWQTLPPHPLPGFSHVTLFLSPWPSMVWNREPGQLLRMCNITTCYSLWEFNNQN